MKLVRYFLQLVSLMFLAVCVLWLYGNLAGLFASFIPSHVNGRYGLPLGAVVLLLSGAALGLLLSVPSLVIFGRKWGPLAVGLAGVPVASMSAPPHDAALVANGGVLAIVGALSCTFVSALAAAVAIRLIGKMRGPQEPHSGRVA